MSSFPSTPAARSCERPSPRTITIERSGDLAWIVMNRPPLNVLDQSALRELRDAWTSLGGDEGVGAAVLIGEGRAFSAGVSVEDHLPDRVEETLTLFDDVIRETLRVPFPVIAGVNGAALGGGCELALAADIVLLQEDARIGQPEIGLGAFPPAAAALLPRLVGRQRALDLILSGSLLGAEEAYRMGLVSRILPVEGFREEVEKYAGALASRSRPVTRLAKRAVMEGLDGSALDAMERAERLYLDELVPLADAEEGLRAFLEKRRPRWTHGRRGRGP